jgi:hypothetical protein
MALDFQSKRGKEPLTVCQVCGDTNPARLFTMAVLVRERATDVPKGRKARSISKATVACEPCCESHLEKFVNGLSHEDH